ncbi:hypothetical protein H4582DRAFT_2060072 [Lactarius indigo]|nr:hypothetical protein H4582DRAFT_2060072 [Lactarius indigo]
MSHDAPRTKAVAELGRATTSEDDSGDGFQGVDLSTLSVLFRHHTGGIIQACEYGRRPFPLTQVAVACPSSFKSRARIRTQIHRLDERNIPFHNGHPPYFLFFRLAFALVAVATTASTSRHSAYHSQSTFPMADFWGALTKRCFKFPVARSKSCVTRYLRQGSRTRWSFVHAKVEWHEGYTAVLTPLFSTSGSYGDCSCRNLKTRLVFHDSCTVRGKFSLALTVGLAEERWDGVGNKPPPPVPPTSPLFQSENSGGEWSETFVAGVRKCSGSSHLYTAPVFPTPHHQHRSLEFKDALAAPISVPISTQLGWLILTLPPLVKCFDVFSNFGVEYLSPSSLGGNFASGPPIRVHEGGKKGAKVGEDNQSPKCAETYERRALSPERWTDDRRDS